jgi:formamidopyrimidine-DNA glycosylase
MPELPEVETIRRQLESELVGVGFERSWSHPSAKFIAARDVDGAVVEAVDRRGKYLLIGLADDRELVVHLGMTGQLRFENDRGSGSGDSEVLVEDPYVRAWWQCDDGRRLLFRDVRRFGRLAVVDAGEYGGIATLAAMGPEPFDSNLDGRAFHARLRKSRQQLKTQLLSQRPIAGVGNIYADEALFLAGINPVVRTLSLERSERLLSALREVLTGAIERGGTTLRDYRNLSGEGQNQHHLVCYGRAGQECLQCGQELRGRVIDARSTTWCPHCQAR